MICFKLKMSIQTMFNHILQKGKTDLEIFYEKLTNQPKSEEKKLKQSYQMAKISPVKNKNKIIEINNKTSNSTSRSIILKNQMNTHKKRKQQTKTQLLHQQFKSENKKTHQAYRTNKLDMKIFSKSPQDKQHFLKQKKIHLLQQLSQINQQIKLCHLQQSQIKKKQRISTEADEYMSKKAEQFVKKMNKQRQEFQIRRKKSFSQLNKNIEKSIQTYQYSLLEQEKMKQIKRKQIQKRIEDRKQAALIRKKINQRSNSVIKQLVQILPSRVLFSDPTYENFQNRFRTNSKIQKLVTNPQTNQESLPLISSIQKSEQHFKQLRRKHEGNYEVSPFLQKIWKQQEIKKKQQSLKALEKKRVTEKHKEYADKIRGKAKIFRDNEMFIT